MLLALGAVSSALDALQSLTSSKSSPQSTGFSQAAGNPFDLTSGAGASANSSPATGGNGFTQISPETMSALLAAQSNASAQTTTTAPPSRSDALHDLFSLIDADHDGAITKSEFESALGAGGTNLVQADDVFSKLDKDGNGSVSIDEMASALKGGKGHHHSHRGAGASSDGSSSDPLLQALSGASSTSVTNS